MIIGLTGSFGSGKGAIIDYLVQAHGFKHYSATSLIIEEIKRLGMPVNRDSMFIAANGLRKEHGPAYFVETLFKQANADGGDAVIESLRAVAEAKKIKELGGTVIGADADPRIRYERAKSRGSEKDNVSYEKFLEQERAESNPDDPYKQDIFGALKESDYIIMNNGSFEELHAQID
jgi:dephospho-CoA kinase